MDQKYNQFGPEWKAELKKWSKDHLIDFLRDSLISLNSLEKEAEQLRKKTTNENKEN